MPVVIKMAVDFLAKYTMGIFCLHWMVLKYVELFYERKELVRGREIAVLTFIMSLLIAIGVGGVAKKVKWIGKMVC